MGLGSRLLPLETRLLFTGLITNVGRVDRVSETEAGRELRVSCAFDDLVEGESIALNGACLTVREMGAGWFAVAAVTTTLSRTTLGTWKAGRRVNLERALRASDRIGGHFVLGHVDTVAEVTEVRREQDSVLVDLVIPDAISHLLIPQGSIAIDGVSLTINAILDPARVQLSLIEYTLRHTSLGELAAGDAVNVEADVLGKYVHNQTHNAILNH